MPTIFIKNGLDFIIFTRDHLPPHVHVIKVPYYCKIQIFPQVELMENKGLKNQELKKALKLAEEKREILILNWIEIHGEF